MIFTNPNGAPVLACDECGCRWFDRMTNACYECGAAVTPQNLAEIQQALAKFEAHHPEKAGAASGEQKEIDP